MCETEDELLKLIASLIVQVIINENEDSHRIRPDQQKGPVNVLPGCTREPGQGICQKNNVSISAIFRDDGECSDTFDRPDYIALENFIKAHKGHVNFLIIKDHDRFSRNLSEALAKIEHQEKKFGVKMVAIDEPINIDAIDPIISLRRAFKYLMANHELLNIRKRTTQGIRNAIASGRVVKNAPFGYKNIRDSQCKPTLQIDETRADHSVHIPAIH